MFIRRQKEWKRFINFRKGLHDLFCKLHTTQEAETRCFVQVAWLRKKKRVNQRGVVDEYSHQDNRLDLEKEFTLVV